MLSSYDICVFAYDLHALLASTNKFLQ